MNLAQIYRANAAHEHATAAKTDLPNRREVHERSARRWEAMALQIEDTVALSMANHAAKTMG